MYSIHRNGITVSIQRWEKNKLPALTVQFDSEVDVYKTATFDSVSSAIWFAEIMDEFFKEESHGAEN